MTAPESRPAAKPAIKKKWTLYKRWQIFAPTGLILTAMGLVIFGSASDMMHHGAPLVKWLLASILSLALFVAGLAVFGEAIRSRVLFDLRKKKNRPKRRPPQRPTPRPGK